jgi:M6 family metalloprotease-like protein
MANFQAGVRARAASWSGVLLAAVMAIGPATAQSRDQIIDNCRNTVGRPFVQSCMQQRPDLEACRAAAKPHVRNCVMAAMQKNGSGQGAPVGEPVHVAGTQHLLVVPVRFPDAVPSKSIAEITEKVQRVSNWIRMASYGQVQIDSQVLDWQPLRNPLASYRVSASNFEVDPARVRRLVSEALSAAARKVRIADFTQVYIVVGVETMPGTGYGMITYAANPGMLSGVRSGRARMETIQLDDGTRFDRGIVVSAETAHVGHVAHDMLHAFGGARDGRRAVPDLYDFATQHRPPPGARMHPSTVAIYAGPRDIMSQHFVERQLPPPPPSSFTRLQLGWIQPDQVVTVQPGQTQTVVLESLESGGKPLVVKVPLGPRRYLLLENRQKTGLGAVLPATGLVILEVDERRGEGAGIVRVANAKPDVHGFVQAPFVPGGEPRAYINKAAGVAVVAVGVEEGDRLQILVTTPERVR